MTKKSCSFAGSANSNIPGLVGVADDVDTTRTPEDPAVFGGRATQLPEGTMVEWLENGALKVVEKPEE